MTTNNEMEMLTKLLSGFRPFENNVDSTLSNINDDIHVEKKKEEKVMHAIRDFESKTHLLDIVDKFRQYKAWRQTEIEGPETEQTQYNISSLFRSLTTDVRVVITDYRKDNPNDQKTMFYGSWIEFFDTQARDNFTWLCDILDACDLRKARFGLQLTVDLSSKETRTESFHNMVMMADAFQKKIANSFKSTYVVVDYETRLEKAASNNLFHLIVTTSILPISFDIMHVYHRRDIPWSSKQE